ncbi:hypothetical protein QFZ20_002117 [Flavobacterium sp. W4I14]|nr:hypothetical protein [Flavobacterium sp. W4I14]
MLFAWGGQLVVFKHAGTYASGITVITGIVWSLSYGWIAVNGGITFIPIEML